MLIVVEDQNSLHISLSNSKHEYAGSSFSHQASPEGINKVLISSFFIKQE
jgi:hypothetical protein